MINPSGVYSITLTFKSIYYGSFLFIGLTIFNERGENNKKLTRTFTVENLDVLYADTYSTSIWCFYSAMVVLDIRDRKKDKKTLTTWNV